MSDKNKPLPSKNFEKGGVNPGPKRPRPNDPPPALKKNPTNNN